MDVAITGSSGLIGTALVSALEKRGDRVRRVVRGTARDGEIGWDIGAGMIDAAALEGIEAVVHLAGEGIGERRWSDEQKERIRRSRTEG
ncbi:MAG: NAD-dependent epimerase/dehydratase family protein, partial [Acidimicrobiales bacterium]